MEYPSFIHLKWNSIKDWKVIFTNNVLFNCDKYITTIHLRNLNKDLNVYGDITRNCCNIINKNVSNKHIKSVSFLKSNIQKAVRLGKIDEALVSSFNLIEINFIGFIRRLITISIEDVGIPSTLPFLVWIMMVYPNIEVTNEIIQLLLLTVYTICKYKIKHIPDTQVSELEYGKYNYNDPIINSLLIASEYGGFKGDVALFNRFINSKKRTIIPVKYKNIVLTRTIKARDIIPAAIDFHCYPNIIAQISENIDLDETTIKSLIWKNSSSINYRVSYKITDKRKWKVIKGIFNKIQKEIINKLYIY
tara:strand:+ start:908 stop:1822 length:915 start_codon:yes stop_codon:yes gene_type:complete